MKKYLTAAVIAASALVITAPVSAENMLLLDCKCQAWINENNKPNTCGVDDDFLVTVNFGNSTLTTTQADGSPIGERDMQPYRAEISTEWIRADAIATRPNSWGYHRRESISVNRVNGVATWKKADGNNGEQTLAIRAVCTKAEGPKF